MNWELIWQGFLETCLMTVISSAISYLLGMPLGVLLVITRKDGIKPAPTFNAVLGAVINFLRSIPFILLIAMLIPVTRAVMGTAIGTAASVFPLVISATPYIARVVEQSFLEVDGGVIEAAKAMGSSTWQIIRKVLIPESVPSLVTGAAMAVTTILAYTAMVSAVGGGGIGAYAITKGYQRGKKYYDFMYAASAVLVIMVQIIAITGTRLTRRLDHRIR
jgi:D-methionine transport system permease protein